MRVLVLGGYGGAGTAIARLLLRHTDVDVVIAGRDIQRAEATARALATDSSEARVSARHADACDVATLAPAFRGVDLVVVAATTTAYAPEVATAVLDAGADYLDIYFEQLTYPALEALGPSIEAAGRCFVTQAGFHPGLPSALVRRGAALLDRYDAADVAFGMNARVERPESIVELVDSLADYHADVYADGRWRRATYRDSVRVDLGSVFGTRTCTPMDLVEMRALPERLGLRRAGLYVAGMGWFLDYVVFPLIFVSQKVRRGLLRATWARLLTWGMNNLSRDREAVVMLLRATGTFEGRDVDLLIRCEHGDAYAFTAIPVVAAVLQLLDGSVRRPGLSMMGHLVDPGRLLDDMERMGVDVTTTVTPHGG